MPDEVREIDRGKVGRVFVMINHVVVALAHLLEFVLEHIAPWNPRVHRLEYGLDEAFPLLPPLARLFHPPGVKQHHLPQSSPDVTPGIGVVADEGHAVGTQVLIANREELVLNWPRD